jgi:aerobic carbon-monoxide dehydrogenase medium subunit
VSTALPPFGLHRPATVEEALELLDADRVPYCGGTELLLAMKIGLLRPDALVDLKAIPGLGDVTATDDGVTLGAAATHLRVSRDPEVRRRYPVLAHVAERVGNARVRAQGTVGGNLCFAEPKSDLAAMLSALEATLELRSSANGTRRLGVDDFFEGPYWTVRADDELLTAIHVTGDRRGVYLKYQTMERPTVGVALATTAGGYRLVVGAVSEVPVAFDLPSLEVDADELAAGIDPVADLTGSEEYKRHVTAVYIRRAVDRFRQVHDDRSQEGRDA